MKLPPTEFPSASRREQTSAVHDMQSSVVVRRCGREPSGYSALIAGLTLKENQPSSCLASRSPVLQHRRGLLSAGLRTAHVSFSLFCTQKTPQVSKGTSSSIRSSSPISCRNIGFSGLHHFLQVYFHLGGRSICCCTAIGGSFAPEFVCGNIGEAANAAAARAAESAESSVTDLQGSKASARAAAIREIQSLITEHGTHNEFPLSGYWEVL